MRYRNVCVFCGSSAGHDPVYAEAARSLGSALATAGHDVIYGGGSVGLMGMMADAALAGGAAVTGVITRQLVDLELAHPELDVLQIVGSMHERKARMAEQADAVIVLPGGLGTFEETFEVLTWVQLGLVSMPVVVVDVARFFQPLARLLDSAVTAGFLSPAHAAIVRWASSPPEAVGLLANGD